MHQCTYLCTKQNSRRRRCRRRAIATIFNTNLLFILSYFFGPPQPVLLFVNSAVTWTNGPEDRFFCGLKWDDADCQKRQHCPSGDSEECEGFEDGVKCFANTSCDTRYGHGDWFVPGQAPNQSPGGTGRPTFEGTSDVASDHYWCGVGVDDARKTCGSFDTYCPSGTSGECPQGQVCYHNM